MPLFYAADAKIPAAGRGSTFLSGNRRGRDSNQTLSASCAITSTYVLTPATTRSSSVSLTYCSSTILYHHVPWIEGNFEGNQDYAGRRQAHPVEAKWVLPHDTAPFGRASNLPSTARHVPVIGRCRSGLPITQRTTLSGPPARGWTPSPVALSNGSLISSIKVYAKRPRELASNVASQIRRTACDRLICSTVPTHHDRR